MAELGLAIVTVMDDPRKPIPPPTLQQLQPNIGSTYGKAPNTQPTKGMYQQGNECVYLGSNCTCVYHGKRVCITVYTSIRSVRVCTRAIRVCIRAIGVCIGA